MSFFIVTDASNVTVVGSCRERLTRGTYRYKSYSKSDLEYITTEILSRCMR